MTDDHLLDLTEILAVDAEVLAGSGSPGYGITADGFRPKPFTRLLAEKLALARHVLDPAVDLTSGSIVRKLCEMTALEDARTWVAIGDEFDSLFVTSAVGRALSDLGAELGVPRPYVCASGSVALALGGALPAGIDAVELPRGTRLTTPGGHRVWLGAGVRLHASAQTATVPVLSFDPGPVGNLDPQALDDDGVASQQIDRFDLADARLADLVRADIAAGLDPLASATGTGLVRITHTTALSGGEVLWSDERYRELLLRAPRGLWSVAAVTETVRSVPGVRQVAVRDGWGGLDLSHSIYGDFNFIERLFAAERDVASPYYVRVLVAPTDAAYWDGPGGLQASVEAALLDVRPLGIFPDVVQASQVMVAVRAQVLTEGLVLPSGEPATVNSSPAAAAIKARLLRRVQDAVGDLGFGEPVRHARVLHALMAEPGVRDVTDLALVRFPPSLDASDTGAAVDVLGCGESLALQPDQVAVLVDQPELLTLR